jgi:hypothetical protein
MTSPTKAIALASVAALAATAAGCGSSSPDASKFLDNEKIERAIEHSVRQQRHLVANAQCPALEVKKKGNVFFCQVFTNDGAKTTFRVTQVDDNGHVQYVGTAVVGGRKRTRGASGRSSASGH